jgi:hypothetical protein
VASKWRARRLIHVLWLASQPEEVWAETAQQLRALCLVADGDYRFAAAAALSEADAWQVPDYTHD